MTTMGARNRGRSGPGRLTWVALGAATLMVLGLTFALGMLVGRQWARQSPPAATADSGRRTAAAARRPGPGEAGTERAVEVPREKLTFYKTLTAPLGALPSPEKTELTPKAQTAARPRTTPEPATWRAPDAQGVRVDGPALPTRAPGEDRPGAGGGERPAVGADWAVQVGVFKTSRQADRVQKTLTEAGFPARVMPASGGDGQIWYRVRVGGFKTREEALKTAERVRADRFLPTFVTANQP
jgi:cell division protein FtsN